VLILCFIFGLGVAYNNVNRNFITGKVKLVEEVEKLCKKFLLKALF